VGKSYRPKEIICLRSIEALYSGEGENIGTCRGVVELLELVVILLF